MQQDGQGYVVTNSLNTSFLRFLHTDFKTCFIMENFKYTPKERE